MTLVSIFSASWLVAFSSLLNLDAIERQSLYPFNPTRVSPAAVLLGLKERPIKIGGETIVTWVGQPRPKKPVIVYFHGNAGNLASRAGRFRRFRARGYGIIAMAYRGSSGSTGLPSEAAIISDARDLMAKLPDLLGQTAPTPLSFSTARAWAPPSP